MKVFIAGGTGLLGYYTDLELLERGHAVSSLAIPDVEIGDWFPKEIPITYGDIFEMGQEELEKLFTGYDAMVYAVGPDDRVTPKAPAYAFFHERLVEACGRTVAAAREAGMAKCIVLNSYFAYFNRIWPKMNLDKHHPYIKCRVEQAERVIAEGGGIMDVCVLELPYIFGTMPGRVPLWKDILIKYLKESETVFFPKGGTNMLTVEAVAKAVAGAVEKGIHAKKYLIGDVNMEWKQLLGIMLKAMEENKKVRYIPGFLADLQGKRMKKENVSKGRESGLDPEYLFKDIQCNFLYYDASESKDELGYSGGGIEKSIEKTVKACL